jgi:hypothetical protein
MNFLAPRFQAWVSRRLSRISSLAKEFYLFVQSDSIDRMYDDRQRCGTFGFWKSEQWDRVTIRNQFQRRIFAVRSGVFEDAYAD